MSKPWFEVRPFWGWYPKTWQSYLLITSMFFAVGLTFFLVDLNSHSVSDTLISAFPIISLILASTSLIVAHKSVKPKFGPENKGKADYNRDNPKAYYYLSILALPISAIYFVLGSRLGSFLLLAVFLLLLEIYRKIAD